MASKNIRRGQKVRVHVRGESKDAIIVQVPPFEDDAYAGGSKMVTDAAIVQYPGTSPGALFADISERIPLEDIEVA